MHFSVTFFIKPEVKSKKKPIYALVRKTGMKPVKRSTGLRVEAKKWSNSGGKPTNSKENANIKERQEEIRKEMEKWFQELSDPSRATRKRVGDKLEEIISGAPASQSEKDLFEYFDDFIGYKKERNLKEKTIKKFDRVKRTLQEFSPELSFNDLDEEFYDRFTIWLVNQRGLINKTANKYLTEVSNFLNYCFKKGIINQRLSLVFKELPEVEQTVINLSEEEFEYLEDLEENDPKLQRVLDCFLFSCHTGVRYEDLNFVGKEVIEDGVMDFVSHKTKVHYQVGLSELAQGILEKYAYSLPVPSNQKYNKYLKELFYKHGFDRMVNLRCMKLDRKVHYQRPLWKVIGTHAGRKTYVTDRLRNQQPEELVKASAGFAKDSKSYNRYVGFVKGDFKNVVRKPNQRRGKEEEEK